MHHDCVHAIGHGERLEVGLDGHREGQFVNEVHRCAGDDRTAAQILETEDCGTRKTGTWMRHLQYLINLYIVPIKSTKQGCSEIFRNKNKKGY